MQEVYVIAGGDWYRHVLNAVAAFMQTEKRSTSTIVIMLIVMISIWGVTSDDVNWFSEIRG